MASIRSSKTEANKQFWMDITNSQIQAIYNMLQELEGIPSLDNVSNVHRESTLEWNPLQSICRNRNQSQLSFEEQHKALELNIRQIDKYKQTHGREATTYTKNIITYGAPGTGKSFIGEVVVLYAICQGLNVISSSLMGVRANTLGGIHIHKLFYLPTDDNITNSPFRCAEAALQKIKRDTRIEHLILSMDMIFIDELAQISAQQFSTIDIIMRNERKSQLPFGGALIVGTMDHTQIQPIRQLPLLVSSLILTCFEAIELCHSVRAHGDPDFQRLQNIARMNPFDLLNNDLIKEEFFELASRILTFVPNWEDNRISPNMMRVYSRIRPAQQALDDYRESIKAKLHNDGVTYRIVHARDRQRNQSTNAEYGTASNQSIRSLNKELKEPAELVFFSGGVYECTMNDSRGRFSQSQLAFMLETPPQEKIDRFDAIPLWIAPSGINNISFDCNSIPTRDELTRMGWVEVLIGCAPERIVLARGGIQAKRLQYSLKHIGAITINKSQGETLPLGIAVEFTKQYSPWEKGQVIVLLSRTTTSRNTIIVGDKNFAINKMWELITIGNQWTRYCKHVLDVITVNRDDQENNQHENVFDYPSVYPFRLGDGNPIPTDTTGFVYCLISCRDMNEIYIGQTKCLSQRLIQHNSGNGSQGTEDLRLRPWGVAAYICGLAHLSKIERMSLERRWKLLVNQLQRHGHNNVIEWINAGTRIVDSYNYSNNDDQIRFVRCISQNNI